jgi:hypothetical protein
MKKTITRRLGTALAVLVVSAGGTVLAASPSMAATARNGVCESGEFCYYYNRDEAGSVSDFAGSISDYGTTEPDCYDFKGAGSGQGQCVKNNAASVWNRTGSPAIVFFNSGYGSTAQTIAAGAKANLVPALKNNNASHWLGGVTGVLAAQRGQVWVDANRPYSQTDYYQGYREDCSGFVSMMWGLNTPGLTTSTMPSHGSYITKADLRKGDALLNSGSHVVLFDHWYDSAHTYYIAYEESPGGGGAHVQKIPYPYFSGYGTFTPFRYSGLS